MIVGIKYHTRARTCVWTVEEGMRGKEVWGLCDVMLTREFTRECARVSECVRVRECVRICECACEGLIEHASRWVWRKHNYVLVD